MTLLRLTAPALLLLLTSAFGTAQIATKPAPAPNAFAPTDPSTPQSSEGALWRTDRGFDSFLRVKNVLLNASLTVTPILYMADGSEVDLAPVTLQPAGVTSVDIKRALQSATPIARAHASTYGMAAVKYNWAWSAVIATVQNIDEAESITFHSSMGADAEAVHSISTPKSDHTIQGLWWGPHARPDGFLAIVNTAKAPMQARLSFSDNNNHSLVQKTVPVPPHGTAFLPFEQLSLTAQDPSATGSIVIAYTGAANSLLAYEGIEDRSVGYSASPRLQEFNLNTSDTKPQPDSLVRLAAPAVMVGPPDATMLFPQNTAFAPYAYLYNRSAKPLTVNLQVSPISGQPPTTIGTVLLQPGTTTQPDLAAMMKAHQLTFTDEYTNLVFAYTGQPGDLTAEAGSTDQTRNFVFEVVPTIMASSISRTICFWTTFSDNDTMISVWNYTRDPADDLLTLYFDGGKYKIPLKLAPGQTRVINLRTLQKTRDPDPNGNVIPARITEGSAILAATKGETEPMSVVLNAATFNVRNATCGPVCTTCNGVTQIAFDPLPFYLAVEQQAQASAILTYNTGMTQKQIYGQWFSSDPTIATVDNNGLVTGVADGQASLQGLIGYQAVGIANICGDSLPSCPIANMGVGAPVVVGHVPYADPITSDVFSKANTCSAGSAGWHRYVNKVIVDKPGNAIQINAQLINETFDITKPNTLFLDSLQTHSATTNAMGQLFDDYFVCSTVCPNGSANAPTLQHPTDTVPGNSSPYKLIDNKVLYACQSILVNGK